MLDNADQFKHGFTSDDYLLILPSNLNEQPGASREHLIYPVCGRGKTGKSEGSQNYRELNTIRNQSESKIDFKCQILVRKLTFLDFVSTKNVFI